MYTALLLLGLVNTSFAGELAGITMADNITVDGDALVLNGQGLREKFWIDVYVGGLYLPAKTADSAKAIQDDVAKSIVMHFIYKAVGRDKQVESFREGFAKSPSSEALKDRLLKLEGMLVDVVSGDVMTLQYKPGKGTTLMMNGKVSGVIEGADFMRAVWTVYLGPNPPTAAFKRGLMGG